MVSGWFPRGRAHLSPLQRREVDRGTAAVVAPSDRDYVNGRISGIKPMSDMVSSESRVPRPLLLAATAGGMLLAGTVALWAHYGSAVFLEMIAAGFAACF